MIGYTKFVNQFPHHFHLSTKKVKDSSWDNWRAETDYLEEIGDPNWSMYLWRAVIIDGIETRYTEFYFANPDTAMMFKLKFC